MSVLSKLPGDEPVAIPSSGDVPCTPAAAPWVLAATILASSMAFIDGTVVNIALPALQRDLGATVFDAQWVVESFALFLAALLLVGGAAGDRFGRRRVFAIGGSYWTTFFPAVLVLGFGMTMTVAPLTTTAMNSAGAQAAGVASGVNNAVARVAALLAIAVLGIAMAQVFDRSLDRRLAVSRLPPAAVQAVQGQRAKLAAIAIPSDLDSRAQEALQRTVAESFVHGFRWVMVLAALLAFASAGVALALRGDTRDSSDRGRLHTL